MCGIGGNTIEEAQAKLRLSEVSLWQAVVDRFGSLSVIRHIRSESADQQLLSLAIATKGKTKIRRADLLPHEYIERETKAQTIEDLLSGKVNVNKRQ